MAQKYRKIDPRIWRDEKFRKFNQQQKLLALYVLTAQSNRIGIFVFSLGQASEELEVPVAALTKVFDAVVAGLKWKWDATARVLFIPKWWKYNPPENANNVIGNLKDLDDLPESPLIQQFCKNTIYLFGNILETFTRTLLERYPKGSPTQEQEQEQDIPPKPPRGAAGESSEQDPTPQKRPFGEFRLVLLTEEEYAKLKLRLNGKLDHYINRLDRWGAEQPAKFRRRKNHYATILTWADRDGLFAGMPPNPDIIT